MACQVALCTVRPTLTAACLLNFFIISSKSKSSFGTVTGGALGGARPLPLPPPAPGGPPLPPGGPLLPSLGATGAEPPAAWRKLLGRAGFAIAAAAAAAGQQQTLKQGDMTCSMHPVRYQAEKTASSASDLCRRSMATLKAVNHG